MAVAETYMEAGPDPANRVLRIEPSKGWSHLQLGEVWAFRELLYFLTWRDIKVRYKQSVLGAAWAIIQPVISMVVFTLIFSVLAGLESDGQDYRIWNITALVPWTFFANGLTNASNSLVGSQNLIKKIYFPRLVIPSASVLAGLVDFCLAFLIVLAMMPFFDVAYSIRLLTLPAFLGVAFMIALGMGLWLSALNVQFRDVRFTVPFLVQLWMYSTPIVYEFSSLSKLEARYGFTPETIEALGLVWALNPMVGVVEGFRWAVGVGPVGAAFPWQLLLVSGMSAALIFVGGMFYFRRMEKTFADVV
ncbi:MAG: ABC transporter permease [Gemmatimonadota bacterium]|nr:ABC transporter permease [Gemmatimonadota bacterium]